MFLKKGLKYFIECTVASIFDEEVWSKGNTLMCYSYLLALSNFEANIGEEELKHDENGEIYEWKWDEEKHSSSSFVIYYHWKTNLALKK